LNVCKPSTSTVEHVTICTRCRDVNIEAIDDHLAMIKEQNDHIAKLNAKIAEHELENEKIKFACSMLYNGRCPGNKDGIGFQQGSQNNTKLNAPKSKLSNFVKSKAPCNTLNLGWNFSSSTLTKFRRYSLFSSCFAPSSHFQSSIMMGIRIACEQKPKLTWVLHHTEAYFFCLMWCLIARPSHLVSDFDSYLVSDPWSLVLWASVPA
jgi:hypothetical protein